MVGSPIAGRDRGGDRGADRLLRQHPGAARGPGGRSDLPASCWRGCGRSRWAPTRTRTCRSRSWWRSCVRSATLSHTPLFQVVFALQNAPLRAAASCRGLSIEPVEIDEASAAKFDLSLALHGGRPGVCRGRCEYSTRPVRGRDGRSGWLGHLADAAGGASPADPERRIVGPAAAGRARSASSCWRTGTATGSAS